MKRLTPQEFLLSKMPPDCIWEEMGNLTNCPIETVAEIMQQYAEHLETTAWVLDGSLPPVGQKVNVLLSNDSVSSDQLTSYVSYGEKEKVPVWDSYKSVTAWRPLPTLPRTLENRK